jgi:hypothetical protein
MFVLNIKQGADTAGRGYMLAKAFQELAPEGWTYRSAVPSKNYLAYPLDLHWDRVPEVIDNADIIHLAEGWHILDRFQLKRRPHTIVMQFHGTKFRDRHEGWMHELRTLNVMGLVSTLDLLQYAEPGELHWLPAVADMQRLGMLRAEAVRAYRRAHKPSERVLKIGHAPTDRTIKDTEAFMTAVGWLQRDFKVRPIVIERSSWQNCLAKKASCDIFYDQAQLGYGSNAVEAWGMGIPVICGADEFTTNEYLRRFGSLPYVNTTPGTIYESLRELMSEEHRTYMGQRGVEHARKFHSYEAVVPLAMDLYQRAYEGGR